MSLRSMGVVGKVRDMQDRKTSFSANKFVIYGFKGLCKIKVEDIDCVTLVHHARHHFLEDLQIGAVGPTG